MASFATHLKSKAFFILCPAHEKNGRIFSNKKAQENLKNIGIEISPERDFSKLAKEFAENDYHGYASLIFFVELECYHYKIDDVLKFVYSSIKRNSTVKYVTKLVLNYSYVQMDFGETHFTVKFNGGFRRLNFKYPTEEKIHEIFPNLKPEVYKLFQQMPGSVMLRIFELPEYTEKYLNLLRKNIKMKKPLIDNLIVLSFVQFGVPRVHTILDDFVEKVISLFERKSIQELANETIENCIDSQTYTDVACIETTSNAGCYVFNVNPALAIVINHETFPQENLQLDFRSGSQKDIQALERTFRSKKITYLTINDGSLEDVQTIMKKVQATEFKGIKDIYIVIMSHGDEGDIIYTKTGSYSIRDEIVVPLLENATLANAQKFIIVNACRGTYNPIYDENAELLEAIQRKLCSTVTYPQDEKLMMIFSTQKGCVSLRFDEIGSIFVQEFCDSFSIDFYEKPMEAICEETQQRMAYHVCNDQIPEFQMNDDRPHNLKMEFVNFFSNQELLENMIDFFKKQLQKDANQCSVDAIDIGGQNTRKLLGYADGRLNGAQKDSIENHMKSKYATTDDDNRQDLKMIFEWSIEDQTGRSRVFVAIEDN